MSLESSQFTDSQLQFESIEQMETQGATCDTFRVKLYGKLHFLKRLKPEYAADIRYREALRKEFETGYRLEHPNLVRYISLDDDCILMEYVDGETLSQQLATYPDYFRNRKNTDKFVRQLLSAIGYLHSHQVLHLDLKPDNILLTYIGDDLKLIDLGCCYTDTFPDTTGHTNAFAAPEQLTGGAVDVRSDIYAIGKILELLPTHHIYNKVIDRCTDTDPAERYPSIEVLQQAIFARHGRRYVLLACILLLAVGIILFLFHSISKPTSVTIANETDPVVSDSRLSPPVSADTIVRQPNASYQQPVQRPPVMSEESQPSFVEPTDSEIKVEEQEPADPVPDIVDYPQTTQTPTEVQFPPIRKEITDEEKTLLNDPRLHIVTEEEFKRYKILLDDYWSLARDFVNDEENLTKFPGYKYDNEYGRIKQICLDKMKADQWFWSLYNSPMNPVSSYTREYVKKINHQYYINSIRQQ